MVVSLYLGECFVVTLCGQGARTFGGTKDCEGKYAVG